MPDPEDGDPPMTTTAAPLRGDATVEQRAELKHLLRTRRHTLEWRNRLFAEADAHGLSQTRALGSISYLNQQPTASDLPTEATTWQIMQLRDLMTTRLVPNPLTHIVNERIAAGTLPYDAADLHIADFLRLPLRAFPAVEPGTGIRGQDVPDGYYSVTDNKGKDRCYHVKGSQAGRRVVKQLEDGGRFRVPGFLINQTLDAIGADLAGAAQRYAQITKRCAACNVPLRDEDKNPGYEAGYGPKCWRDLQDARAAAAALNETAHQENEEPTQ